MRTPDPDPEVEAWLQKQLAKREPLGPEQRRQIAAIFAAEKAQRARARLAEIREERRSA